MEFCNNILNPTETTKKLNGEVLTPFKLIEEMLNLLPKEVWENPKFKWLDPSSGIGNFQLVVINRLMKGLITIPLIERRKHILTNMIYYAEWSSLNTNIYRKLIDPNNKYGNKLNIYTGDSLKLDIKKEWDIKKFDIIVGNPPYNESQKLRTSSKSLYHKFIRYYFDKTSFLTFIVPKKFLYKSGMKDFKNFFINSQQVSIIVDKGNPFNNVKIKGGVIYFLKEPTGQDELSYNSNKIDYNIVITSDILLTKLQFNMINKIQSKTTKFLSELYTGSGHFNSITSNDKRLKFDIKYGNDISYIKCYVSNKQLNKNNSKNSYAYINKKYVKNYNKYFVITFSSSGEGNEKGFSKLTIMNSVFNQSYHGYISKNLKYSQKLKKYLGLKFIDYLLRLRKNRHAIRKNEIKYIPLLDLDKYKIEEINNKLLYKHFELTKEEINVIMSQ